MKQVYKIEVDCPNCALKVEERIKKLDGVADASVNFMALKLTVEFCEGADEKKVMKEAQKAAKKVERDCKIYF
ncbi:MAG: heavy-metal-associated domain-containing protein [Ruminococcaceae bacterium]|nr:heavy-metal-associated domain-containing protein [Oscillospiraceae bacterium]